MGHCHGEDTEGEWFFLGARKVSTVVSLLTDWSSVSSLRGVLRAVFHAAGDLKRGANKC